MSHVYIDPKSPYWMGCATIHGRRRRFSLRPLKNTASKRTALEHLHQRMRELWTQEAPRPPERTPFGTVAKAYLAHAVTFKQYSTYRWEWLVITRHFFPFFRGETPVCALTTETIQQYAEARSATVRAQTLNKELAILGRVLRFAQIQGWLATVPTIPRKTERITYQPPTLTPADIERVIAAAETPWLRLFFLLQANAGLRKSEALRLQWPEVDLAAQLLTVQGETKTGTSRTIPLNTALTTALQRWKLQQGGRRFVVSLDGTAPVPDPQQAIRRAYRQAGFRRLRVKNLLRHAFATNLLHQGVPVVVVQKLLGHGDIRTTMRYVHVDLPHLRHATDQLGFGAMPVGQVVPLDRPKMPETEPDSGNTTARAAPRKG